MSKTPVSILQEMMVKKQMVPGYDLIHDGGGTHDNTFIYRVSCAGLSATGTGRSKKEAKHEAAKAMLEAIAAERAYPQLPAASTQSPVKASLPASVPLCPKLPANAPFFNAIGDLKALCCDYNLGEPIYEQVSDIGPPHERIFTVQCIVATFKEEAAATTKKQAKHEAARKMLERLRELLDNLETKEKVLLENESKEEEDNAHAEIAKALYLTLTENKKSLGLNVSEYYQNIGTIFTDETRKDLVGKLSSLLPIHDSTNVLPMIKEFLESIELKLSLFTFNQTPQDTFVLALSISGDLRMTVCAVGNTEEEAKCNAIAKLIEKVMFLFDF